MSVGPRSRMTMRCTVERNKQASLDSFGQRGAPVWESIGDLIPCYIWQGGGAGGVKRLTHFNPDMIVSADLPGGTISKKIRNFSDGSMQDLDLRIDDRISNVTDRLGNKIFGQLRIDDILVRRTHYELTLQEYK